MKIFIDWFIADLQYCVSFRSTAKIFSYIYICVHIYIYIVKITQLCLTLCDPMDYSWSGSSVHGIFQVRILEWVGVPFSRDLPNPGVEARSPTLQADFLLRESPGKPIYIGIYLYSFLILSHYGLL